MTRNVEAVQAIYQAFGKGDIDGGPAHLDPSVDWEHSWGGRTLTWFTPRKGLADVPGFFASLADFEFVRFEPFAFLEGGNMVASPIHIERKVKATGKVIRDLEAHLWTFGEDGRVVAVRHLVDTLQFAEATAA